MFGILLPPENTIKESAPMQVQSHSHANLFGVILAFFCLVLKKVYRC